MLRLMVAYEGPLEILHNDLKKKNLVSTGKFLWGIWANECTNVMQNALCLLGADSTDSGNDFLQVANNVYAARFTSQPKLDKILDAKFYSTT